MKKNTYLKVAAFTCGLLFCFQNPFFAQTPIKKLPKKGQLNLLVHPADLLVCEGTPVTFRAFAACPAPEVPHYQWQSSADGRNWDDIAGEENALYGGIGLARRPHNGSQFRVRVHAGRDTIWSFPAQLLVESGVYFTQNPQKQTVAEGAEVQFEAKAESESGNGVASYQWQFSPYASGVWSNLPGEILPVLRLPNVTAGMNGHSYRLLARSFNQCDSAVCAPAFLAVSGRPVVSITPLSRSLCGGGQATFSVQLQGGTGREICQWQRKTASGAFENLPSEKDFTLKINEITTDMNAWQYRALVKLADGSTVETQAAVLTVNGKAAFKTHPQPFAVCAGEAATFSAAADFEGKTPDCQWQFSTDGGNSWQNMPDARGFRLEIPFATADLDGRQFRASADAGLCGTVYSQAARLTIFPMYLRFTRQPRDVAGQAGVPAIFEADFEGASNGSYSVTWEWSGNGGASWQFMPGGKDKTLTLTKVGPDMTENLYRMKVLDKKCGRISYSEAARVLF